MGQDTTSALAGLASFAKLQNILAACSHEGSAEAMMTFETFEVTLGKAVRDLENELKAAALARYDVDVDAVLVDGQEWRKSYGQKTRIRLDNRGYDPAITHAAACMLPIPSRILNVKGE